MSSFNRVRFSLEARAFAKLYASETSNLQIPLHRSSAEPKNPCNSVNVSSCITTKLFLTSKKIITPESRFFVRDFRQRQSIYIRMDNVITGDGNGRVEIENTRGV